MADRARTGVGEEAVPPRAAGNLPRRRLDIAKTLLDALLALALLLQMARHFSPDAVHEVAGIALAVLAVAHLALNRRWFAQLSRGPWSALRALHTVVNLAMPVLLAVTEVSGIGVAGILPGLSEALRPSAMRGVHRVCVYTMLLLFSLHLGMEWTRVMARVRRALGAYSAPKTMRAALRIVAAALAAWGAYELFALGILDYITLRTRFAFIDTSQPLVPYLAPYAAVMALFVWAGHYLCALLTACARRSRDRDPARRTRR